MGLDDVGEHVGEGEDPLGLVGDAGGQNERVVVCRLRSVTQPPQGFADVYPVGARPRQDQGQLRRVDSAPGRLVAQNGESGDPGQAPTRGEDRFNQVRQRRRAPPWAMAARAPSMDAINVPDGDVVEVRSTQRSSVERGMIAVAHADHGRLGVAEEGLVHAGDCEVRALLNRAPLGHEVEVSAPGLVDDERLAVAPSHGSASARTSERVPT